MNKLFLILVVFTSSILSFGQTPKYASFEADIANSDGIIYISKKDKVIKKIEKNSNGVYKDTLNVQQGSYKLFDGKNTLTISLNNECDLKLKMDANNVNETIVFSGIGSEVNNYLIQYTIAAKKIDFKGLFALDENTFMNKLEELKLSEKERLDKYIFNPEIKASFQKGLDKQYETIQTLYYKNKKKIEELIQERELKNLKLNGSPSPSFDYDNYAGGKTKLEDFKGKYVYIDVWATWCGPCRAEIPFLKKVEEKYHDKNISFVSISIDQKKDVEKWKTMIKDKVLGGVQLFADNDWNSKFVQEYMIKGIPRFILIDPNGNILQAEAARPSSPELQTQLDKLLK